MCGMQGFCVLSYGVVLEATIMCRMQGLWCINIRHCAGGYNNVCDAGSFVFYHKGLCGRLQ